MPDTQTINGLTITNNNDGTVTINGTASTSFTMTLNTYTANGTYVWKYEILSGTISTGSGSITSYDAVNKINYIEKGMATIKEDTTFTVTDLELTNRMYFAEGTVCDNLVIRMRIELGTTTGDFEQYGVSPSPDYPSDIRNVGDNANILNNTLTSQTINGITLTVNKDKSITINGTATKTISLAIGEINLIKGKTYTLSGANNGNSSTYRLDMRSVVGKAVYNGWLHSPNDSSNKPTLTMTETITLYSCLRIQSGATINNVTIYPKLEEGSIATSYTPYNCGSVDIKTTSKNLLDINTLSNQGNTTTHSLNGSVITVKSTSSWSRVQKNITLKSNKNYTLMGYVESTSGFEGGLLVADSTGTYQKYKLVSDGTRRFLYVNFDTNTYNDMNIQLYTNWSSTVPTNEITVIFKDIMLIEGTYTTEQEYQSYQSKIYSFPLSEGQLLHKGDYLAEDGIHQVRKTLVFDGTESWSLANNVFYKSITDSFVGQNIGTKCTHFKEASNQPSTANVNKYNPDNSICCASDSTARFYIKCTSITSVDEFKTFLSTQYANGTPVTVEYGLAEEIVIPYTPEQEEAYYQLQHLLMYEGYTSIECIDEIKPDIQVTYSYNNEINTSYGKKIDSLEERIRQLEKTLISLTSEVSE